MSAPLLNSRFRHSVFLQRKTEKKKNSSHNQLLFLWKGIEKRVCICEKERESAWSCSLTLQRQQRVGRFSRTRPECWCRSQLRARALCSSTAQCCTADLHRGWKRGGEKNNNKKTLMIPLDRECRGVVRWLTIMTYLRRAACDNSQRTRRARLSAVGTSREPLAYEKGGYSLR